MATQQRQEPPLLVHGVAGATASVCALALLYPLDQKAGRVGLVEEGSTLASPATFMMSGA